MTDFGALLKALSSADVQFIVVGGLAGTVHGAARQTFDIDVVYERSDQNLTRLVAALAPHQPYLRDAPPGLPFKLDQATLKAGFNFTLTTELGEIDLLGFITGGGEYDELVEHSISVQAFGVEIVCLDLETLIRVKRAAGRPKDFEAIAELESLLEGTEEDESN